MIRVAAAIALGSALAGLGCAAARAQDEPAAAAAQPPASPAAPSESTTSGQQNAESICLIIEAAARAHKLPLEFFARVIWQESRFRSDAVGPLTRSGQRAQGIAQFMPRTASERGLLDPFDPVQALPKSAQFLSELRADFGNLGLAAAAYNAGPQRVRDYIGGRGGMPAETRSYVAAITGATVDEWVARGRTDVMPGGVPSCGAMLALLKRAPNPFVQELEQRVALVAAALWGVQLNAGFSREHVLQSYARIATRHAGLLEGHDPSIIASRNLSRGTRPFYQVRIGAETRRAAEELCGRIRRGGGDCMVLRTRG